MLRENVEISQAITAAWNAGDMDAIREMYDSRVVLVPAEGWPEPGPFAGRDAVLGWYEQIQETWDAGTLETLELSPCDQGLRNRRQADHRRQADLP